MRTKRAAHVLDFIRLSYPDKTNPRNLIADVIGVAWNTLAHLASNNKIVRKFVDWRIKDDYFAYWSHDMAYILGFLMADGNVQSERNCLDVSLHEKDVSVLDFMASQFTYGIPVRRVPKKHQVRLTVYSAKMKADLISLGVVPHKTGLEKIPESIPPQFIFDFIRGFFDGDGTAGEKAISVVSASPQIIKDIKRFLQFGHVKQYVWHTGTPMHLWVAYSIADRRRFYELVYMTGTFCLERKKSRVLHWRHKCVA